MNRTLATTAFLTGILLSGCASTQPIDQGAARFDVAASASLIRNSDSLLVRLRVLNVGVDTQTVKWGACLGTDPATAIRAYRASRTQLAWDWSFAVADPCYMVEYYRTLVPGDSAIIWGHLAVSAILGDSLPSGTYDLTVTPKYMQPPDSEEINLGSFTLRH